MWSDRQQENAAVARALYAAFARRDLAGALELLDPAVELRPARTSDMAGHGEPYRGHEGIRAYFAEVERVWAELDLSAEDFRTAGDSVIVFGHARGRAHDGATFEEPVTWLWKIRDGRAISGQSFSSRAEAEHAARAEPAG